MEKIETMTKQEIRLLKLVRLASKIVLIEDIKLFKELAKKWQN